MSDLEFDAQLDKIVYRADNVHNKEDLVNLIWREQAKEWDIFDRPLYRAIVVEDFSKESSYVVWMFQHCFIDGMKLTRGLHFVSDNTKQGASIPSRGALDYPTLLLPFIRLASVAKILPYALYLTF